MNTRREFLVLSSMAAIAAAAVGPKLFAAPPTAASRLAVGFAAPAAGVVADAASVPTSDGSFISHGARISFVGARNARRALELTANFSYFDGANKRNAPFRVWARGGNGVSFDMPVELDQKLTFVVAADSATTLPLTLTLQNQKNALMLTRGFYVIAPLGSSDSAPKWSNYELKKNGGRWELFDRRTAAPATLEHFVLRVDYANSSS